MEIHIGDSTYRLARKMNAFQQWDVMSKISPLLAAGFGEIAPLLVEVKALGLSNIAEMEMGRLMAIATPVSRELSHMSNADRRFIASACLAGVDRKRDGKEGWAKIWNADAEVSMFSEINEDGFLMLRLVLGVLYETFKSFLPTSLSALSGEGTA